MHHVRLAAGHRSAPQQPAAAERQQHVQAGTQAHGQLSLGWKGATNGAGTRPAQALALTVKPRSSPSVLGASVSSTLLHCSSGFGETQYPMPHHCVGFKPTMACKACPALHSRQARQWFGILRAQRAPQLQMRPCLPVRSPCSTSLPCRYASADAISCNHHKPGVLKLLGRQHATYTCVYNGNSRHAAKVVRHNPLNGQTQRTRAVSSTARRSGRLSRLRCCRSQPRSIAS